MSGTNNTGATTEAVTGATPPAQAMTVFNPDQLPAVVTERVKKQGDLISVDAMTQEQIATAKDIAQKSNLKDTMFVLRYAAAPQQRISGFYDTLLSDIKVREAGVAGDMAKQMAEGIDIMKLAKVKQQIESGNGRWARFMRWCGLWTNYLRNFYVSQQSVTALTNKIEQKANNKMVSLDGHVKKLDGLVDQTLIQIRELEPWLLAGEIIILHAYEEYSRRRDAVLQTHDVVAASELRDLGNQIAAFEKRILEAQIAYIDAGNVAIPQIRQVQEADKIEIQNISEQILFQMPKFKRGIVLVAALADLASAREDRRTMDANQRELDTVVAESVTTATRLAKESQGDPLQRVEDLERVVNAVAAGVTAQVQIENESREKRRLALEKIIALRDVVGNALKSADLEAARS